MALRSTVTLGAVVVAGVAAAWWGVPALRTARALALIGSDDAQARSDGWAWLVDKPDDRVPRALTRKDAINDVLARAGDEALLDGADAMYGVRAWGWAHQPRPLLHREMGARTALGREPDQVLVVELMAACPLDLDRDAAAKVLNTLLASEWPDVRLAALRAGVALAGPDGRATLDRLSIPRTDTRARRLYWLARSWIDTGIGLDRVEARVLNEARRIGAPPAAEPDGGPAASTRAPAEAEAKLLWHVRAGPEDATFVVDLMERWTAEPRPAFEYLLRYATDPAALDALGRRADQGNSTARFALHTMVPGREAEVAQQVLSDPQRQPWEQRLAAWRLGAAPVGRAEALLDDLLAEPDAEMYAAALLAERLVPRDAAIDLAEAWIRDFNDGKKQAGALLAALLGEHEALLLEAYGLENEPEVRTTQRLALHALGEAGGAGESAATIDARELAHRAGHDEHGDFRPEIVMCRLMAGDVEATRHLTSPPSAHDWRRSVQQRAWLIERFVPAWHEAAGRPLGGDPQALLLHFEALDALHELSRRRLEFDRETRTFAPVAPRRGGQS